METQSHLLSNKLIYLIIGGILVIFITFSFSVLNTQSRSLTIEVSNINTLKGNLIISIYNNRADFPKEGKEYRKYILKVDNKVMSHTFTNLPIDEYAIALFHDENSDQQCNTNRLGFPIEAYGFSKNVKPLFSPPPFRKAKFKIDEITTVRIALIH